MFLPKYMIDLMEFDLLLDKWLVNWKISKKATAIVYRTDTLLLAYKPIYTY